MMNPTKGDHIWSSGCGEFFYRESYCDERVVMTIYEFQIFCDVSSGEGYALIGHMGGAYPYMGTPQVFRVPKTDHSLLLVNTESIPKCGIVSTVSLCRHNFILQS